MHLDLSMYSYACTWSSRFPVISWSYKATVVISLSSFFFKAFLGSLSCAPTVIHFLRQPCIPSIASNCFQQMPLEKRLFTLGDLSQVKLKQPCKWRLPGYHLTGQIMTFSGNEVWKELQPISPSSVFARMLFSL